MSREVPEGPHERLVGRLRDEAAAFDAVPDDGANSTARLLNDAADELDRLRARVTYFDEQRTGLAIGIDVRDAELDRLRALLAEAERLCMEHCPSEMSDALRDDWQQHQTPNAALTGRAPGDTGETSEPARSG
jgi:hypothetical protein